MNVEPFQMYLLIIYNKMLFQVMPSVYWRHVKHNGISDKTESVLNL